MKITWGNGSEKSLGNGVFRLTVKEAVIILGVVSAALAFVHKIDAQGTKNAASSDSLNRRFDALNAKVDDVRNRVLVLETVSKTVQQIKVGVRNIQNEEIFDPEVTNVKVKR